MDHTLVDGLKSPDFFGFQNSKFFESGGFLHMQKPQGFFIVHLPLSSKSALKKTAFLICGIKKFNFNLSGPFMWP